MFKLVVAWMETIRPAGPVMLKIGVLDLVMFRETLI